MTYEVFERVGGLDPRVWVHWIMAGKGSWMYVILVPVLSFWFSFKYPNATCNDRRAESEEATREVVWRRPVNVSNTQVESEHLARLSSSLLSFSSPSSTLLNQ